MYMGFVFGGANTDDDDAVLNPAEAGLPGSATSVGGVAVASKYPINNPLNTTIIFFIHPISNL